MNTKKSAYSKTLATSTLIRDRGFTTTPQRGVVRRCYAETTTTLWMQTRVRRTLARGFTVIEIIVVISVVTLIVALSFSAFSRFNKHQKVNGTATEVVALLKKARSLTLASKDKKAYGVHFESNQAVLFKGNTYVPTSPDNMITTFSSNVAATTSFTGGGTDVLFKRLTGETDNDGTVIVYLLSDTTSSSTITIYPTGITEY